MCRTAISAARRRFFGVMLLLVATACAAPEVRRNAVPPGDFDLVIDEVVVEPEPVRVGEGVGITFTYRNRGRDTIPGYSWRIALVVGRREILPDYVVDVSFEPEFAITSSTNPSDRTIVPLRPGLLNYHIELDPDHTVPETDESNNVIDGVIEVLQNAAGPRGTPGTCTE